MNFSGDANYLFNVNWAEFSRIGDVGGGENNSDDTSVVTCEFSIADEWSSGFVGELKITNNGNIAIDGDWSVALQFTDGSTFLSGWSGQFSGSAPINITPEAGNRTIAPNSSTTFGLEANKGSANLPAPTPVVTGSICG